MMKQVIENILVAHNCFDQFQAASSLEPSDPVWSITVVPAEGSTAFSSPLIIAREQNMVRCAHFHVGTYDVEYNPLVELSICSETGAWSPVSIFRFYNGLKRVGDDADEISIEEANEFTNQWALHLKQRQYHNVECARILKDPHELYQAHL